MTMSVDKYFTRVYRPGAYNCLHFAAEVWLDITGHDLHDQLTSLMQFRLGDRSVERGHVRDFVVLEKPEDPCLVMMQRLRRVPHIGVWIRGSVLHLQARSGVQYMPLHVAAFGFERVRYFKPATA